MTTAATPDYAVLQAAAQWFAVLRGSQPSAQERQHWQAWIDASPAHREAWRRVEAIDARFQTVPSQPARQALLAPSRRGLRRRQVAKAVLALAGVAVGGRVLLSVPGVRGQWAALGAQHRTGVGETRRILLADGTHLWLNTASAADGEHTATLRRIALRTGEILVQSAPDTQYPGAPRPLVVDVPQARLRALGTRFSVRLHDDGTTELAVYEGAVRVEPASGVAPSTVQAGWQVRIGEEGIAGTPVAAEAKRAAWSRGLLVADGMRLDDFVQELARYRHGYLGCAPEVAHLRLVGVYPLADTDRVLAALQASLPVSVRRTLPWWVSVGPG